MWEGFFMEKYKVERLRAEDYDELLNFMNCVYNIPAGKSFREELPKMWRRTDEAMGKHLAIRIDGRIAAVVGVYPLPMTVAGQELLFTTVGNVGTLPKYRNLGLMKTLMVAAMKKLEVMGADASRLGGERQRYNRYGYEIAGCNYHYCLTRANIRKYYDGTIQKSSKPSGALHFKQVVCQDTLTAADTSFLQEIQNLQQQGPVFMLRGDAKDCYDTASSWGMHPWIAQSADGQIVGYLSASSDHMRLGEQFARTPELLYAMILEWAEHQNLSDVQLQTAPWELDLNRSLNRLCEECTVMPSSNFKIIHWDKVLSAYLNLKNQLRPLPSGHIHLEIQGYGTLRIDNTTCIRTPEPADLSLDALTATRFLFGPYPPEQYCSLPENCREFCAAAFPLPLGWNGQERV